MPNRNVTLTIASGASNSDTADISNAEAITIYPPATLTGTVTVQASADDGSTFLAAQSAGSDITVTVSKALSIVELVGDELRLSSGSSEGADRTFIVAIRERVRS